jgi:hypothetical protein
MAKKTHLYWAYYLSHAEKLLEDTAVCMTACGERGVDRVAVTTAVKEATCAACKAKAKARAKEKRLEEKARFEVYKNKKSV